MKNRTLTSEVAVTQRLVILNKANTPKAEGRGIFLEGRESPTMRTRSLLVIYFIHTVLCYSFLSPRFSWITFVFIFITLGDRSKRSCCNLCQSVLPMFSFKTFIVSGLSLFLCMALGSVPI